MPIYEYACKKCGHEFEELVRAGEQPPCPKCGEARKVERKLSTFAAVMGKPGGCEAVSDCPSKSSCCSGSCHHNHGR